METSKATENPTCAEQVFLGQRGMPCGQRASRVIDGRPMCLAHASSAPVVEPLKIDPDAAPATPEPTPEPCAYCGQQGEPVLPVKDATGQYCRECRTRGNVLAVEPPVIAYAIEPETIEPERDEDWPALSHAAREYAWLRRTEADAFERMVSAARYFEAERKRCDAHDSERSVARLSERRIAVRERYNTWIQASSALHESAGTVTALVNLVDEIVEGERWAR